MEIPPADCDSCLAFSRKTDLSERFRALGFDFTTLDLRGYVSGSMDPKGGG
jgi:PP-loop superfamily ATP-utilizing enzyme